MGARHFGLLATAAGIWGASFLFMAIGLEAFEPGLVTLFRVGFGALTLACFPAARGQIPRSALPRFALLGFLWMALPLSMFPIAQQWIDSSVAGMLNSGMPVMTVLVAAAMFATPTSRVQLIGVAVGLVGIVLIGIPTATAGDTNALGVGLVILAVISYGFAINIAVPLQQEYGSLPVLLPALSFATLMVTPYGLAGVGASSFGWGPLAACAALGIGGTAVAYIAMATLAGEVGAVRASIVTYLIPVVSVLLGVIFRDETVAVLAILGTGVVLLGAWLTTRTDED